MTKSTPPRVARAERRAGKPAAAPEPTAVAQSADDTTAPAATTTPWEGVRAAVTTLPVDPRAIDTLRLRALAQAGLSTAQAAGLLGVTRNTVIGRARDRGIRFHGAPFIGGGCNSEQARRGAETRRARRQPA